jgi:cysteine desulfurase/selenocysteine lyase
MRPFMGGGEMISDVRLDGFEPAEPPWRFEAGTPPIAEAIGLGAAVDYLGSLGMQRVREHDHALSAYTMDALAERYGHDITVFGPRDPKRRGAVLSLAFMGIHPHDLSQVLDDQGICVRAGHHCAKPLMRRLGVPATTRASFYVYNDTTDADALVDGLAEAARLFR